ncbi:Calmodulin-regulated spectrin-associated protein 1-B [Larimichthys crocea]|uniref:Calmodulin-regulated spectrin-associated protein 1-B n=1 Tax=Larimichthys crocea TaxID=215358 RepID=A0A6G0I1Z7_LARCR|nr:Calmodulin-regulated spectrin-associated protein 1-B [Larimichthys crocea]
MVVSPSVVPSELLQLHMQLEEQRRAIEYQKKKMETLSARQRLKLGKAAFLNIVKKGGGKSDTLPLPLKHSESAELAKRSRVKTQSCKDDSCLDALKGQATAGQTEGGQAKRQNRLNSQSQDNVAEPDLNECSHSIDLLNEAISSIQHQMMQLSLQQDLLMKRVVSPPERTSAVASLLLLDVLQSLAPANAAKPRSRNMIRDNSKTVSIKSPRENPGGDQKIESIVESSKVERNIQRNTTFRVHDDGNQHSSGEETGCLLDKTQPQDLQGISSTSTSPSQAAEEEENNVANSGKEATGADENTRVKGQLIEDDEKAEDEMAKRRAAFLLKQQRKAEESRLRKQQQEAESELKRDEAREDRVRKEEEKARRELIKQEYLRRKQQALMEEQGLVKPRPRTKSRRSRPKSLHREESNSLSKASATPELSCSHRGSTLSLATEADSVISGGAESQRAGSVCSMESFPMLSRASSRNFERDWENGSIASSITSMEYNGPKLFKEPSSKSNKPIIINAIAHCCLAGRVNESQKNAVLEELEKCESNHLIILFRDGGCQFRAIYSYSPDTEEIVKFTGTGPRTITRKMIDKLYKYSSDRKQFTVIPAKSVSVSVDALTIHNQLWQVKRPGSARRK